jgi:glycosyltransferase involved in cell wall biosynthesis
MLVCAWTTDHRHILQARKRNPGLKIVHRVDNAGREYGRSGNCDERLANINKLVDVTIFQSRYSRYVTMEKYKLVKKDGPIIYNPIDTDLFNPDGPKASLPPGVKICNASWSTNPMKGTGQIPSLAEKNPDFHFILCGRYDSMPELPNIHFLGQLCKEELAKVMRSSDVFFFPSRNEACPNVVIEALASGLPIVYHDSGATKELVGDCGLPVEEGSFRSAVHTIVDRKREYSEEARERAIRMFGLEIVCRNYLDVIEGMLA